MPGVLLFIAGWFSLVLLSVKLKINFLDSPIGKNHQAGMHSVGVFAYKENRDTLPAFHKSTIRLEFGDLAFISRSGFT